ncbi:hypothetical protein BLOT_013782 [Blomia tropicalis]|nr:hypothetical protein BLOT_013782 [Blomia tropicalis]
MKGIVPLINVLIRGNVTVGIDAMLCNAKPLVCIVCSKNGKRAVSLIFLRVGTKSDRNASMINKINFLNRGENFGCDVIICSYDSEFRE